MKLSKNLLAVSLFGLLLVTACENIGQREEAGLQDQQTMSARGNGTGTVSDTTLLKQSVTRTGEDLTEQGRRVMEAVAVLHPTEGNKASGVVRFFMENEGVRVTGEFAGLEPGKHGFHIHELGDCSAPDAASAGGHYNPTDKRHGAPYDDERHVGDLGNIEANEPGQANYDRIDAHLFLNGPYSIVGRAVIVHSDEDDFVTQPTGDAGSRMACGIIGIAEEE